MQKDDILVVAVLQRRRRMQEEGAALAAVRDLGARGCAATPRLMVVRRSRGTQEITATAAASVRGCAGGGRGCTGARAGSSNRGTRGRERQQGKRRLGLRANL
jgi:hypothetical protein